jgi:CubicO group peptidase (beta-lactamase class C family)
MTVRQLMAHTSGMRDSLDLLLQTTGPGLPSAPDAQFTMLTQVGSINFKPGTSWNYNNGGYVLLSEIVERLSGEDFGRFLRQHILEPVGLYDSLLRPLDTELVPNSATLHVPLPTGGWCRGVFGPYIRGEGAIVSTVDDMLRWLKHMSAPFVGSKDTWTQILTPLTTHGYGLGMMIDEHRGLQTIHHAGGVIGGSCQMIKVLGHDLDVIVLSNGRNALELYGLAEAIIDACIPGLPRPPEDAPGERVSGTFYSRATGRVITLIEHDGKQAMSIDGTTLPARRDADGSISVAIVPTDLRLKPSADGSTIELTEFGAKDELQRVEPRSEASLDIWLGAYSSDSGLDAELTTVRDGYALRIESSLGGLTYQLRSIGPDLWQMVSPLLMPLGGTLEFNDDGYLFTTGRTLRLKFERAA